MRCGGCGAQLGQVNGAGEPMLRTRAIILKAEGVALACPKCKADVPLGGEMAKAIQERIMGGKKQVLFLKAKIPGGASGDLLDQAVQVAGHSTRSGAYVAPYTAHRKKAAAPSPAPAKPREFKHYTAATGSQSAGTHDNLEEMRAALKRSGASGHIFGIEDRESARWKLHHVESFGDAPPSVDAAFGTIKDKSAHRNPTLHRPG